MIPKYPISWGCHGWSCTYLESNRGEPQKITEVHIQVIQVGENVMHWCTPSTIVDFRTFSLSSACVPLLAEPLSGSFFAPYATLMLATCLRDLRGLTGPWWELPFFITFSGVFHDVSKTTLDGLWLFLVQLKHVKPGSPGFEGLLEAHSNHDGCL